MAWGTEFCKKAVRRRDESAGAAVDATGKNRDRFAKKRSDEGAGLAGQLTGGDKAPPRQTKGRISGHNALPCQTNVRILPYTNGRAQGPPLLDADLLAERQEIVLPSMKRAGTRHRPYLTQGLL